MQNSRAAYVNHALATAAFTVAFAAWSIIAPLSKQIQSDLNLDNKDQTGNYALGFVLLSTLAACCLAILLADNREHTTWRLRPGHRIRR